VTNATTSEFTLSVAQFVYEQIILLKKTSPHNTPYRRSQICSSRR